MHVLLARYGSLGDGSAARFDTVAAAAGECDAPVAAGVAPNGGER